jgi:hypothetical protein
MKFHPILFSPEMVKALLEGRKTMTRRECKHQFWTHSELTDVNINGIVKKADKAVSCPYGEVGDVLWVREEHYAFGIWEKNGFTKSGRRKWKFRRTGRVYYNDNQPEGFKYYKSLAAHTRDGKDPDQPSFYKRLARFMPKKFCRIFLQIKSIRVERLKSISHDDAIDEGVFYNEDWAGKRYKDYSGFSSKGFFLDGTEYSFNKGAETHTAPIASFCTLWHSIHSLESWLANPWVWVIEFEQISKPKNFNS